MPELITKPLSSKDKLAFNLHVSHILKTKDPRNIILDNFCKRLHIDVHDFIRLVKSRYWNGLEEELRLRKLI